jgi:acyl-lipid omega-6 desaturase (Delta-12 desaturase)
VTLVLPSTVGQPTDPRVMDLGKVTLGTVRKAFSPVVYRRSARRAFTGLAVDLALFAGAVTGVVRTGAAWGKLGFGVIAGIAVAFLFVWAHDAAHGALFRSSRVAEVLGTIAMAPSLSMYRLWVYGHNKVHHGFTSLSTVDWIWRPMTPAEYTQASKWSRAVYRVERSLPGCALHFIARVWWPGMVRYHGEPAVRRRYHFIRSKAYTFAYVVLASALAWRYAGGWIGVVSVVVVPWLVFSYFIALFVYLHHTHPQLPFFNDRHRWSASIGQVACSTLVRTSAPFEWLTHGIMLHTPHHVDMRIPFYRLPQARRDLLAAGYGDHIVEYRFRWSTVLSIFRTCQLFDFDQAVWYRFRDLHLIVGAAEPAVG